MATYLEISNALNGQTFEDLRQKVWVAVLIKAQTTIAEAAPAGRKAWAKSVFSDSHREADQLLHYLIAANNALTISQMSAVVDSATQAAVNTAVNLIYPD